VSTQHELQSLLLTAAFADPMRALPAWTQWQVQSQWEAALDFDSYLLLPQVYHNLGGRGVEDALFRRLKGVVKRNWLANTATLSAIAGTTQTLQAGAIDAVLLPPCALLLVDRSMALPADTPIAYRIGRGDAQRAVRAFTDRGGVIVSRGAPRWCMPGYIAATRSVQLRAEGILLTLRWHDGPSPVTRGAVSHGLRGQTVTTLDTAGTIQSLLDDEGMGGEFVRLARALLVLQRESDHAGWRYLLKVLHSQHSPFTGLVSGLSPVPVPAVDTLVVLPEAKLAVTDAQPASFRGHYRQRWQAYRAALGEQFSRATALRCLPGYLMGRWGLQRPGEVVPRLYRAVRYQWRSRRQTRVGSE